MNNQEFMTAVKRYMEEKGLTVTQLAETLGKPRSSIDTWVRLGIKKDKTRARMVERHPQIFGSADIELPVVAREENRDLLLLARIEQTRFSIAGLAAILSWFLLEASAEDRNRFRDLLGKEWTNFLELTRAMTNEAAFDVTKQEGRLEWLR